MAVLGLSQVIEMVKYYTKKRNLDTEPNNEKNTFLRQFFGRPTDIWILLLPHLTFIIMALLWRSILPGGGSSHLSVIGGLSAGLLIDKLIYYCKIPSLFFIGVPGAKILYMATIPIAIMGIFKRLHSDYHIVLYGILTILVLIVWPYIQGLRFMIPLIPFYISFVLTGTESLTYIKKRQLRIFVQTACKAPFAVILAFLLISSINNSYENIANQRKAYHGPYTPSSKEVFSFISRYTSTNSIIVFRKPRVMRLLTNRRSLLIDDVNKLERGDYLCLSQLHNDFQLRNKDLASLRKKNKIRLLYKNTGYELYQIRKKVL